VDVGDLSNHVKYYVSVLSLIWAMIMNTADLQGEKSPTIGIKAYGLKWCLIFAQK